LEILDISSKIIFLILDLPSVFEHLIYVICIGCIQGINSDSQPIKIISRRMKETECVELNCHDAWFGFSLSAIGDVDFDGFEGSVLSRQKNIL